MSDDELACVTAQVDVMVAMLDTERALTDDAAKVFAMPPGPRRIEAEEWWLARYREARRR